MKVLGGSHGRGSAFFSPITNNLKINPDSIFHKNIEKPISDIVEFEEVGTANSSSLGSAGIGAAAGFLLAGPLAGLLGLALGAASGAKHSTTFGIGFKDKTSFLINANAKDYFEIKKAISSLPRFRNIIRQKNLKKSDSGKAELNSRAGDAIAGRARKKAPDPNCNIFLELNKKVQNLREELSGSGAGTGSWPENPALHFLSTAVSLSIDLNTVKWRHHDDLVSDEEVRECIMVATGYYNALPKSSRDTAKIFYNYALEYISRSDEKKSENNEELSSEYKEKSKEYLGHAQNHEKLANQIEKTALPQIEVLAKSFLSDVEIESSKKKYTWSNLTKARALHILSHHSAYRKASNSPPGAEGMGAERRLEDLIALKSKGLISESEYEKKRMEIISKI